MGDHLQELRLILRRVRRRWMTVVWLRAASKAAAATGVVLLAALGVVLVIGAGGAALLTLAALVALLVAVIVGWTIWSLRRSPTDRQVARYIEEQCPELEDRLASAVALLDPHSASTPTPLATSLIADATSRLESSGAAMAVRGSQLRAAAAVAVLAGMALAVSMYVVREPASRAYQLARLYAIPSSIGVEVTPGNVRIRPGQRVTVTANVTGALGGLRPEIRMTTASATRSVPMEPLATGGAFRASFDEVQEGFTYDVAAGHATSARYTVLVVRPPHVTRIDLQYEYPASLGLRPRTEEDSGDIYAPAGTTVKVRVEVDKPIASGRIALANGSTLDLAPVNPTLLGGTIQVNEDGSYRIALTDTDGEGNPGDTEYFIRTLENRPPDVRILRPAGDRQVTRLQEVPIEARAEGVGPADRLEVVYSLRGGAEKAVPFRAKRTPEAVNGAYTFYLEDLDIAPGDFVSYYARVRDPGRGRHAPEARSDIFFLEVTPFEEEFVSAQSQGMGGGSGDPSLDSLIAAQKEIVVATWKLDRRGGTAGLKSEQDIRAVGRAQADVKQRAEQASGGGAHGEDGAPQASVEAAPGDPAGPSPIARAIGSMARAVGSLETLKTADALPHEMEAYNQLLKARAAVRQRQIQQQQANGGGGGSGRQGTDVSSLFDRELKRQQQTNYETPNSAGWESAPENDPLARVRELARRQSEIAQQQAALDRQREQMTDEEMKRQLERLTREQSELRQQAEELARQMGPSGQQSQGQRQSPGQSQGQGQQSQGQQGQQGQNQQGQQGPAGSQAPGQGQSPGTPGSSGSMASQSGNRLREASEDMQGAASQLRRQDLAEAAARGNRALEKLRDLERQLQGAAPNDRRRALGDLQIEARQLADAQRKLSSEAASLGTGHGSADARRRLAGEGERIADRVDRLESGIKQLSSGAAGREEQAAIDRALADLQRARVAERTRQAASAVRGQSAASGRGGNPATSPQPSAPAKGQSGADAASASPSPAPEEPPLAGTLDGVADQLARAGSGSDPEARQLAEQIARAQTLRDRLGETDRRMQQLAGQAGQGGESGKGAGAASGEATGSGGSGRRGSDEATDARSRLQEEYAAQLKEAQELMSQLRGAAGTSLGGQTPEDQEMVLSAPGTEAFKQDFTRWEGLRQNVATALERIETQLSRQLQGKETRDQLAAGADDRTPEEYRTIVDRYFESLSKKKP